MSSRIFVVSAPSGTGKTTLISAIRKRFPDMLFSVSYTTRPPREGELEGREYHFVSEDEFRRMVDRGEFIEWAQYATGKLYGTPWRYVRQGEAEGRHVVLDIDVQGARQLKEKRDFPPFVSTFVLPPSRLEQIRRLRERKQNKPDDLVKRVREAPEEIRSYRLYDFVIVNNHRGAEEAAAKLIRIVEGTEPKPDPRETKRTVAEILATYRENGCQ